MEDGSFHIAGVASGSSPIRLDFLQPGGAVTGHLLPTGRPSEEVTVNVPLQSNGTYQAMVPTPTAPLTVRVSCVDAANPFVFVHAEDLALDGSESLALIAKECTGILMSIRQQMAVRMGLASTVEMAKKVGGTPKIAIIAPPREYTAIDGTRIGEGDADIWVRPFSMGAPHPAVQITGAVCIASAAAVKGTIVHDIVHAAQARRRTSIDTGMVVIGHASGTITVSSQTRVVRGSVEVISGNVYRTARRLMEGTVLYLN